MNKMNKFTFKKSILPIIAMLLITVAVSAQENSWIAAENQNGLKISCETYILNEQTYLAVSFENLTNAAISCSWSLGNGSEIMVSEADLNIGSLEMKTIKNESAPIPFSEGDSQAMMTFTITTN